MNWNESVYATTTYAYNARDQLSSITQPGVTARRFDYDGHGRLAARTTPEQGTTRYSYHADDTLQTMTDARGATQTLSYNGRHLVTGISNSAVGGVVAATTIGFSYDQAGNRTQMRDGEGSTTYDYDALSRLQWEIRTFETSTYRLSYEYNLAGQLTRLTNPWTGTVGYTRDTIGRVTAVTGSGYAGVTSYARDIRYRAFGGLMSLTYGHGRTHSRYYDTRLRLIGWHVGDVMGWNYSYNHFDEKSGRVTYASSHDQTLNRSYGYDHVGRLTHSYTGGDADRHVAGNPDLSVANGPYAHGYGYDERGNLTTRGGWGGWNATSDYGSFANNRNPLLGYDAAGNVTGDGGEYRYDATGQQVEGLNYPVGWGGYTLAQRYDGDRLRVKKVERGVSTYYVRSAVLGGAVISEVTGGSWQRGYVYGAEGELLALQGASVGGVNWVHMDPVTKSQRLVDGAAVVKSGIDLDPWGGETSRSWQQGVQPHRFTTYERDGNGRDQAQMRSYHAYFSRFDQPDPSDGSYDLTNPQSLNRYAYVQNDPVNFVDPSGLNMASEYTRYGGDDYGMSFHVDGVLSDAGTALGLIGAGAGGVGPASTTRYNAERGHYEFFTATGNGLGWIPLGAHHIGGQTWGWTDWSTGGTVGYSYTFTEDRLSRLTTFNGEYAFKSLQEYYNVHGAWIGSTMRGLEMNPISPIDLIGPGIGKGIVAGIAMGGLKNAATKGLTNNFKHAVKQLGVDPHKASKALHAAKKSAGRGGANNVLFNPKTGDIVSPQTGEVIGNLLDY